LGVFVLVGEIAVYETGWHADRNARIITIMAIPKNLNLATCINPPITG
jgi:hypothetical protein